MKEAGKRKFLSRRNKQKYLDNNRKFVKDIQSMSFILGPFRLVYLHIFFTSLLSNLVSVPVGVLNIREQN